MITPNQTEQPTHPSYTRIISITERAFAIFLAL